MAATYSPTMQRSTIGDAELNDPVRNGKGWDLSAITTLIIGNDGMSASKACSMIAQSAQCFAVNREELNHHKGLTYENVRALTCI